MDTFGGVCCLSSSEGIVAVAGRRTDIGRADGCCLLVGEGAQHDVADGDDIGGFLTGEEELILSEVLVGDIEVESDICSHRYGLADDDLCGLELEQFHTEMFVSLALGMEREFVTVLPSLGFYIHIGYYYADAGRILPVGMIEKLCGS